MSEAAVDELKAMIESQETKVKLTALVTNFHASHSNIPKKLIKAKIRQIAKYKNGTWSCGTSADSDNKGESKGEGVASKTSSSDKKSSTSPSVIDLLAAAPKAKPKPAKKVTKAKVRNMHTQSPLSMFSYLSNLLQIPVQDNTSYAIPIPTRPNRSRRRLLRSQVLDYCQFCACISCVVSQQ